MVITTTAQDKQRCRPETLPPREEECLPREEDIPPHEEDKHCIVSILSCKSGTVKLIK